MRIVHRIMSHGVSHEGWSLSGSPIGLKTTCIDGDINVLMARLKHQVQLQAQNGQPS